MQFINKSTTEIEQQQSLILSARATMTLITPRVKPRLLLYRDAEKFEFTTHPLIHPF